MSNAALDAAVQRAPLVMRFGAFGDMVLLTVLLRQLHARFGQRVDVISSGPWTQPLLESHPAVGRLFIIRSRRTPYWMSIDQHRLVAWLRARGQGPTWYCDRGVGKDLLYRGGIPEDSICDWRTIEWSPDETFADRYIRLANEAPSAFAGRLPPAHPAISRSAQIVLQPEAHIEWDQWRARAGLGGHPYIIVHPGSRHIARRGLRSRVGVDKYWPEQRWGELIRRVREVRSDHAVLLTGTTKERRLNADIIACAGATEVHNVAGDFSVRTLLALLENAHSVISVDTGPAHAAAALGRPTVAVFGTADPVLYRPGGATTPAIAVTGHVDGVQNILGISVDAVMTAWSGLLRTTEVSQPDSVKCVS